MHIIARMKPIRSIILSLYPLFVSLASHLPPSLASNPAFTAAGSLKATTWREVQRNGPQPDGGREIARIQMLDMRRRYAVDSFLSSFLSVFQLTAWQAHVVVEACEPVKGSCELHSSTRPPVASSDPLDFSLSFPAWGQNHGAVCCGVRLRFHHHVAGSPAKLYLASVTSLVIRRRLSLPHFPLLGSLFSC